MAALDALAESTPRLRGPSGTANREGWIAILENQHAETREEKPESDSGPAVR